MKNRRDALVYIDLRKRSVIRKSDPTESVWCKKQAAVIKKKQSGKLPNCQRLLDTNYFLYIIYISKYSMINYGDKMKNIFTLIHSISTKQTLFFVKYITFIIIVVVLLLESNSVVLYSALTYLVGITFDIIAIKKQISENVNNKLYIIENIIMVVGIISIITIAILKISGHTNIPFGRAILNIVLIITTPHPLIEGLIKYQESEGEK